MMADMPIYGRKKKTLIKNQSDEFETIHGVLCTQTLHKVKGRQWPGTDAIRTNVPTSKHTMSVLQYVELQYETGF